MPLTRSIELSVTLHTEWISALVHLSGNAIRLLWKQQRITFREQSSCSIWFECHSIQRHFISRTLEMCRKSFGRILQIHLEKSQSKSGKAAAFTLAFMLIAADVLRYPLLLWFAAAA